MSKNRKIPRILKIGLAIFLLLNVCVGLYRERTDTAPTFSERLKERIEEGIQEAMIRKQNLLLLLLSQKDTVFLQKEESGIQYESRLEIWEKPVSADSASEESLEARMMAENETAREKAEADAAAVMEKEPLPFSPITQKQRDYNWEEFSIHEALMKEFYVVDKTTAVETSLFHLQELRDRDMTLKKNVDGPQILIYHTHSCEAFADSVEGDDSTTIMGAGQRLAEILTEEYGYQVLHYTARYDVVKRDYAYSEALPDIQRVLKENPTIEVVIDLHRDAVAEDTHLVTEIEGRKTAKVMFFNGLSRTREKGEIGYLPNPYLQQNLSFSFQMQTLCNEYYPDFARKIYLRAYRYNMHLCPKTLLIELGAQTNTVEEIHNALEPLAHVLHMVLSGEEETIS